MCRFELLGAFLLLTQDIVDKFKPKERDNRYEEPDSVLPINH
jgi:hypothetical protein